MKSSREQLHLHIEVAASQPRIWRDIVVSSEISLATLSKVIQCVFGWPGHRMHEFSFGMRSYGIEYPGAIDLPPGHEEATSLASALGRRKSFVYLYGLGNGWELRAKVSLPAHSQIDAVAVCVGGNFMADPGAAGSAIECLDNPPESARLTQLVAYPDVSVGTLPTLPYPNVTIDIEAINLALEAIQP